MPCFCLMGRYFNPRSPHGERHAIIDYQSAGFTISIHAPRTGSDHIPGCNFWHILISIHAPRTGSDCRAKFASQSRSRFQSTLPARGATAEYLSAIAHRSISIHAPRTGSDRRSMPQASRRRRFQSTLPARGATHRLPQARGRNRISIHAPRTGSDYMRAPQDTEKQQFQSTLPARGATWRNAAKAAAGTHFNPRSPHGERQHFSNTTSVIYSNFNPRSPHGERQLGMYA